MKSRKLLAIIFSTLIGIALLAACNLPGARDSQTPPINATEANQTAIARVTEFIMLTEAAQEATAGSTSIDFGATPSPDGSATPEGQATPTATGIAPTARPSATPVPCDLAAPGNPIDVTIPDDAQIVAGAVFTKTWRLVNVGTCTWSTNYDVVWDSGAQIGNADVVALLGNVAPGQTVDISVVMTAPTDPDTYQSNWLLRNDAGVLFGVGSGGDAAFWVRIDVVSPTPTPTVTPTFTPTPNTKVEGAADLTEGDLLDLDTIVTGAADSDLLFASDGGGGYELTTQSGASWGLFGTTEPGYSDCQSATYNTAAIAVDNDAVGDYYCITTNDGRIGWFIISTYDGGNTVKLTILIWSDIP